MRILLFMFLAAVCPFSTLVPSTHRAWVQPVPVQEQGQRLIDLATEIRDARELQEVRLQLKRGSATVPPLFAVWDEVWIVPKAVAERGGTAATQIVVRPVAVLWPDGLCLQANPDSKGGQGVELRLVNKNDVDRIVQILSSEGLFPDKKNILRFITTSCDSRHYRTYSKEGRAATLTVETPGSTYKQLNLNGDFLPKDLLVMSKDAGVFELLRSATRGRGVPIEKIGQEMIRGVPVNAVSSAVWFRRE
jgi:hypothetical protein